MRTVAVSRSFRGSVHEAERCWYDTDRWPDWVDGLERVVEVTSDWPSTGSSVIWESGPAGRGRVTERVVEHEPLSGMTVEVEDGSIRGQQTVGFSPVDEGTEVWLALDYEIKKRTPFTLLVDALFIRKAMQTSLAGTLSRFGAELAHRRAVPPGGH